MKPTVYAVKSEDGWSWRATPDVRLDLAYWLQHNDGRADIVMLEQALSWGQAVWIKACLERSGLRPEQYTSVRRELTKRLRELGIGPATIGEIHMQELSGEGIADLDGFFAFERSGMDRMALNRMVELLRGRSLLPEELQGLLAAHGMERLTERWAAYVQLAALEGRVALTNGVRCEESGWLWQRRRTYACRRCGSGRRLHWSDCMYCGTACPYCEECLTMGRARFCTPLIVGLDSGAERSSGVLGQGQGQSPGTPGLRQEQAAEVPEGPKEHDLLRHLEPWGLNPAQTEASTAALGFLRDTSVQTVGDTDGIIAGKIKSAVEADLRVVDRPSFLIWAVTGAGKTEMIFPLVSHELAAGRRVLIATPRRDVVLELMPRLAKAFPRERIVTLYGGSKQRWEEGSLTLATTHQLLRFWQRFDLVVIDELDAFPFHGNPVLEYAARKVCRPGGRYVLLSATPPPQLQREAARGRLPHARVPVRYHRKPLPVPATISSKPVRQWLKARAVPEVVCRRIQASLDREALLFVFVPAISLVEPLVALLRRRFPGREVQGTSSKDTERAEKVIGFRERRTDIMVTTTILERGVTVPRSDVFILDADSAMFNEAALVQMAGRAGRSKDDPNGRVYLVACERTRGQRSAIAQIKRMNAIAQQKGYLQLPDAETTKGGASL